MSAYEWKSAACIRADANVAGKQFEQLEKTVGLTPENVLNANRAENTPLHNEFEWNDAIASEKYRLRQASHLITNLTVKLVVSEKESVNCRAYLPTTESKGFEHISVICRNEDKHAEVLARALKELQAFTKKYELLSELQPVRDAVAKIVNATSTAARA